jgi:hypothetical protein
MSGVEGAERQDYDERKAGIREQEVRAENSPRGVPRLRSGKAKVHEGQDRSLV